MIEERGGQLLREQHKNEIERAIRNAKRTAWDKWFRREWYRAAARRRKRFSSHRPKVSGARRWIEND
jgi:hypothetical protein